jgi:hypothetical protein
MKFYFCISQLKLTEDIFKHFTSCCCLLSMLPEVRNWYVINTESKHCKVELPLGKLLNCQDILMVDNQCTADISVWYKYVKR